MDQVPPTSPARKGRSGRDGDGYPRWPFWRRVREFRHVDAKMTQKEMHSMRMGGITWSGPKFQSPLFISTRERIPRTGPSAILQSAYRSMMVYVGGSPVFKEPETCTRASRASKDSGARGRQGGQDKGFAIRNPIRCDPITMGLRHRMDT